MSGTWSTDRRGRLVRLGTSLVLVLLLAIIVIATVVQLLRASNL
jgi:hypothetical protein